MSTLNNLNKITEAVQLIQNADYVLIGAGAGLSAAGGLNYLDKELFRKWFPKLSELGLENIGKASACFWQVNDSNRRTFWAYWATHIQKIRYDAPALQPYQDLFEIIKDKNYFVITTNVDGQFIKAGFLSNKIYAPQGDYALFQCDKPCSEEVYGNQTMIKQMLSNMDNEHFQISEDDIPRCPKCGSYLAKNLRVDDTFVELPHQEKQPGYIDFINQSMGSKLVLLELGVGFNTPAIIRWSFEDHAYNYSNVSLVRINKEHANVTKKIASQCLSINFDIRDTLSEMKNVKLMK